MNSSENNSFDDLEAELLALGAMIDVPPPPADLAATVRARLPEPVPSRRPRWTARRIAAVLAAFLVVLVAATPQGRAAVVSVLRFAGVQINVEEQPGPLPTGLPSPLPGERRVTLEQARAQVTFPLATLAALPAPDDVRVADGGRVVSMFWPGVRLDQYHGMLTDIWRKELGPPFPESTFVNGVTGVWIPRQHGLEYLPAGGGPPQPMRLAGPTLIWQRGQVGMRLEGPPTLAEARVIADSVR
ncbi:hypothetical protein [Acrocarpospora catenulata]|uniref:hypothetical protein n=1 Tax=Acrocarpospora catenulata TaxID=2836182 RepID=UPI001BDA84DB|nr:hypothetical protein [Acrocarpospora catenulata]